MLTRSLKAFTLLELMVAFIIMAILSAVAVPSLIGVVNGDQATGDAATAMALVDTAYDTAFAADSSAPINYNFVGQDNITAEWEDSGYSIPYALGYSGTIYFQFGDPIYVAINVGADIGTAPSLVSTSGTSGGGAGTTTGVISDGTSCSVSFSDSIDWSVSCSGVLDSGTAVVPVAYNGIYYALYFSEYDFSQLPTSFSVTEASGVKTGTSGIYSGLAYGGTTLVGCASGSFNSNWAYAPNQCNLPWTVNKMGFYDLTEFYFYANGNSSGAYYSDSN